MKIGELHENLGKTCQHNICSVIYKKKKKTHTSSLPDHGFQWLRKKKEKKEAWQSQHFALAWIQMTYTSQHCGHCYY